MNSEIKILLRKNFLLKKGCCYLDGCTVSKCIMSWILSVAMLEEPNSKNVCSTFMLQVLIIRQMRIDRQDV